MFGRRRRNNEDDDDNTGEIGFDLTDGDMNIGIGGGLTMDTDGDIGIQIAPGIDIDMFDSND